MKDKLTIQKIENRFYLQWYIYEENEMGHTLGDGPVYDEDIWSKAISLLNPEKDSIGFYWETKKEAAEARKIALFSKRELLDWEKIALANGWKPPIGW